MTTIDQRIKEELSGDTDLLNDLLPVQVLERIPTRTYLVLGCVAVLILGIGIYCLVQFLNATETTDLIRSGVWLVVTCIAIVFVELWTWIALGRLAVRREIRQLEVSIRRLITVELLDDA